MAQSRFSADPTPWWSETLCCFSEVRLFPAGLGTSSHSMVSGCCLHFLHASLLSQWEQYSSVQQEGSDSCPAHCLAACAPLVECNSFILLNIFWIKYQRAETGWGLLYRATFLLFPLDERGFRPTGNSSGSTPSLSVTRVLKKDRTNCPSGTKSKQSVPFTVLKEHFSQGEYFIYLLQY